MQPTLKILHAAETIKGGVETVIRHLVDPANAHERTLEYRFVFPKEQVDPGQPEYGDSPYHFSRSGRGLGAFVLFSLQFCRAMWRERPDVVHLHSTFGGVLGRTICLLMRPMRRPAVVYCPHAFAFLMDSSPLRRKLFAWIERTLAQATSRIVCVSRYERDAAIASGLPADKLALVYNGTPLAPVRARPSPADDRIRLLYVGRFDYQKGVDILCDALAMLPPGRFHLTVVGGSVHDAEGIPDFPPGTEIKGWVNREMLEGIYARADALVVPSRWEGFAMTPLEGMAHGLPVIASDCTSLPELVADGINGYTFTTGSAPSLADVLAEIDRDTLPELGRRARATVEATFTVSGMVDSTRHIYREVAKRAANA